MQPVEPYPEALIAALPAGVPGPCPRHTPRAALAPSFVAALQRLEPRDRAVLLLCDVLGYPPAEAASMLGGGLAATTAALARARKRLDAALRR
jgi:RNA polymerase sigma-70 factor (ECF subfamily)